MTEKKTWKRELAVVMLLILFYFAYVGNNEIVQALVWPTFTFAGLAFGLDWGYKQLHDK